MAEAFADVDLIMTPTTASLPLFESAQGLPIGIQLAGKQDEDHVVLRVAAQLELATAWTLRHPPRWAGSLP